MSDTLPADGDLEIALASIHLPDHLVANAFRSEGQLYWERLQTFTQTEVQIVYRTLGLPDPDPETVQRLAGKLIHQAFSKGSLESRLARLGTSPVVLPPKDAFIHLLEQLQLFYVTSMTWVSVLWQAGIPLVAEPIYETTDGHGRPHTYMRWSNKDKVEALLTKCLHGTNAVLRLGRYDPTQPTQPHLTETWSRPGGIAPDPNYVAIDLDAALRETVGDGEYNFFHMRMTCNLIISKAYEAAKQYRFTVSHAPEFEFLVPY